jgi:hypothetical protein
MTWPIALNDVISADVISTDNEGAIDIRYCLFKTALQVTMLRYLHKRQTRVLN